MTDLKIGAITAMILATAVHAVAEEITLTTYYPSPRGVYDQLRTLHNTNLALHGLPRRAPNGLFDRLIDRTRTILTEYF